MTSPTAFAERYAFPLDVFQVRAIDALDAGRSVLVAAPTGAGKTVVAEFAVARALDAGRKCFYTTPLKALSNQKFGDFVSAYGRDRVGLLTGDNTINGEAPIVVMTTEVLRNMLYERSDTLTGLQTVVMDEVHYLQDPYRGAVWEEVLIHLPPSVAVVCLSATISNAEEFGEWIATLRGHTDVVIEEQRPIPLEHHYLVGDRLHPMHVREHGALVPNPYVVALDREEVRYRSTGRRHGRGRPGGRAFVPRREDVVEVLQDAGMLPAIYFVFSRAGCERSVRWLAESGIRLTTREEARRIRDRVEERAAWIDDADLAALGFPMFLEAAASGVAAHHAGMLPVFKEAVEELFEAGLIKVVFATETLSLGINMPAKTVVIEDLWKFQGERHELVTPGEYTQLTGRAGRRGIDALGHAVVVYQRQVPFERVAGLAATRTYDLTSSFRPSYNMAVNLVRNYTPEQAHEMLNSSFAQFLADRGVVALERARKRDREALESYREHLVCDRGDFDEYWALRREARQLRAGDQKGRTARSDGVRRALGALTPGDVIAVPKRRDGGSLAVVLAVREGRPTVLTDDRSFFRLAAHDFTEPPAALTRIALPRSGSTPERPLPSRRRRPADRAARAPATVAVGSGDRPRGRAARGRAGRRGERAPVPRVPGPARSTSGGPSGRTSSQGRSRASSGGSPSAPRRWPVGSIACSGCSASCSTSMAGQLTDKGRRLTRIYGEGDLLVGEALAAGVLADLEPSEIAALVSTVVYEARERTPLSGTLPTPAARGRFRASAAALAADPAGGGRPRGPAVQGARARVRGHRARVGRGRGPRVGPQRDRDGAGRLRPQLQAADRPAPPDRGRLRARGRLGRACRARVGRTRRRRVHGRVATMTVR